MNLRDDPTLVPSPPLASPPPTPACDGETADGPVGEPGEGFDRWLHAQLARLTAGVSPPALLLAYADWLSHLALSPAKQAQLLHKAWRKLHRLALYLPHAGDPGSPCCIEPLPQDKRFAADAWRHWPFNAGSQASCWASSGGTTPPPACAAFPGTTRTW
jgi:polyhydroxyalkanoate synthase